MVGISAERSSACEVVGISAERSVCVWCACGGGDLSAESLSHILRSYTHCRLLIGLEL